MAPLRAVLDTNVVVSAFVFNSLSFAWLYPALQNFEMAPLVSVATRSELERVLRYQKFRLNRRRRNAVMRAYLLWCEMITISEIMETPECRDPNDRSFLELALFGQADALVTGDDDLLALGPEFSIPIITPAALRTRLENARANYPGEGA